MSKKGQHLLLGSGLDLKVRAQPDLLVDSVLGNVLSNAIQSSPAGATIEVHAETQGERVRITLSDQGPGLPLRGIEQLEQDEGVPSAPGTEGERGQGFGLQLAQEHVERMNGRLELTARACGGTDAIVWLEADESPSQIFWAGLNEGLRKDPL